jgi:hypothetical protein
MRQLLAKYVCVRVTELNGIDIGLFDFDGMNTIYFFVLNADERIYLRYGGGENSAKNASRPLDEFLSTPSFELALQLGLEQHMLHQQGTLPQQPRPAAKFPRDVRSIKVNYLDKGKCFHCHFPRHYGWGDLDALGKFAKKDVWVFPKLTKIGLHVDVDKGVVLERATGAASQAGMIPGDKIVSINDHPVLTYGDLHYRYHKLPHEMKEVTFRVERGSTKEDIRVPLPKDWRVTNVGHRIWRLRVNPGFGAKTLAPEVQKRLGLNVGGFSSRVWTVRRPGELLAGGKAGLTPGDVIYAVDGAEVDAEYGQNLYTYIKLKKNVGETIRLKVLRDGRKLEISYELEAEPHTKWADALRKSGRSR